MAVELATAYVSLAPSFKGVSRSLRGAFGPAAFSKAAKGSGSAVAKQTTAELTSAVSKSKAAVTKASAGLVAARNAEANAVGKVRVAESALASARGKYAAGSTQVVRAEERLSAARRAATTAGSRVGVATQALTTAQTAAARASSELAAAQGTVANTSGRFGRIMNRLPKSLSRVSSGVSTMGRGFVSVSSRIGSSLRVGIASPLAGIASQAAGLAAAVGLGALGSTAVSVAVDLDNTKRALTGLYGSGEIAGDMMARLRRLASNSPIDVKAFTSAGKQLAYMGLQGRDAEQVLKNVSAAVVASGGDSQKLNQASSAMLKIVNSGKVYADQLNQISDAGVPIFSGLAAHFDTNIENVREMVSKGKVGLEDVLDVVQKGQGKTFKQMIAGAENVQKGVGAEFSKLRNRIQLALADVAAPALTRLAGSFAPIGDAVESGLGALPGLLARIKKAMDKNGVTQALVQIRENFESIGRTVGPLFQGALKGIAGVFVTLVKALVPVTSAAADFFFWMNSEHSTALKRVGIALGVVAASSWAVSAAMQALAVAGSVAKFLGLLRLLRLRAVAARVALIGLRVATLAWSAATAAARGIATAWSGGLALAQRACLGTRIQLAALRVQTIATSVAQKAATAATRLWAGAMALANRAAIGTRIQLAALSIQTIAVSAAQKVAAIGARIWAAGQWLLNAALTANPIGLVIVAIAALVAGIIIAYKKSATFRKIVQAAWAGIKKAASVAWNRVLKPTFSALGKAIQVVGKVFVWWYKNIVRPQMQLIGKIVGSVWNRGIKPVFNALKTAITRTVPNAFRKGVSAVTNAWQKIQAAAKKPVSFLLRTVIKNGIVKGYNWLAGKFGVSTLNYTVPAGFARGGILPGSSSWRNGDDQLVPMRRGEGVYVSEAMRDPYERARLHAVNRAAMRGQSLSRFRESGFAKGGVVGRQSGYAKGGIIGSAIDWLSDKFSPVGFLKDRVTNTLDGIGSNQWAQMLAAIPKKLVEAASKFLKKVFGVSGDAAAIIKVARAMDGKPYVWGGASKSGADCSGFMSILRNVGVGEKNPYHRTFSTASFAGGRNVADLRRNANSAFQVAVNPGSHMWGRVKGPGGKWYGVESGGSYGRVKFGSTRSINGGQYKYGLTKWGSDKGYAAGGIVRRLDKRLFPFPLEGYPGVKLHDNGGVIEPGLNLIMNKTGKPEASMTNEQWSNVEAIARQGASPLIGQVVMQSRDPRGQLDELEFRLRKIKRGGVYATNGR